MDGARRMVEAGGPDRRASDRRTPTVVSRKTCYPGASFNSFGTYRLLAAGVKSTSGEPKIDGVVLGPKAVVCREGGTLINRAERTYLHTIASNMRRALCVVCTPVFGDNGGQLANEYRATAEGIHRVRAAKSSTRRRS